MIEEIRNNCLVKFSVPSQNNAVYCIYGNIEIDENTYDAENLRATILDVNNNEITYEPNNYKWSGIKYDCFDMLNSVIEDGCLQSNTFVIIYSCDEIKNLIANCQRNSVNNIPTYIWSSGRKFELDFLSETTALYLGEDNETLAVNVDNKNIYCSGMLAEGEFTGILESILEGEDKFVYSKYFNSYSDIVNMSDEGAEAIGIDLCILHEAQNKKSKGEN